jgi:autotransporter-associated beta strand protein
VSGIDVSNGSPSLSVSATVNNLTGDLINLSKSIVFFGINSVSFSETLPVSALSFIDTTSPLTLNVPNITTSGVQQYSAAGGLTKAGSGTLALAQTNHYPGLTDVAGGTLQFNAGQTLSGGLHIAAGATAVMGAGNMLTTSAVTFDGSPGAPQGRLDLTNGQLLITFGNTAAPISAVTADIAAGFNHGLWNGQGTFSSMAAADPARLGLGYSDGIDGVVQGLAPGSITVKLVVLGDVNLDGAVNFADLLALAQHFGQSSATWDRGDLNYDASVAFPDLLTLAQHFGSTLAARAATSLWTRLRAR